MKNILSRYFLAVVFLLTLLFPFIGLAQTDLLLPHHFLKDTTVKINIQASGNFYFSSNAITNDFVQKYYLNKFIDENAKTAVTKKIKNYNRLGSEANAEISATFRPDSANPLIQAFIAYRQKGEIGSDFNRDMFELYFKGNKAYAGKTADLSNFNFGNLTYNQFVFGLSKQFPYLPPPAFSVDSNYAHETADTILSNRNLIKHDSTHPIIYAGFDIAINTGRRFLNVKTNNSTLFTDQEGRSLDGMFDAIIQTEDSNKTSTSNINGFGTSLDIFIEYTSDKSILRFSMENFGVIKWNKWSTEIPIDTALQFTGIDVSNLFDFRDSIKSTVSIDSSVYYNLLKNRTTKQITTVLPWKTSISYARFFMNKRLMATLGTDLIKTFNAYVRFYGIGTYNATPSNDLSLIASYGGFTSFHAGFIYLHRFPHHLTFEIGSTYLYPMIAYHSGTSQGGYLIISKSF